MVKVLIAEDEQNDFIKMYAAIKQAFGNYIEIFPKFERGDEPKEWWPFFKEEMVQTSRFSEIIEYYSEIDLFIIDASLLGEKDTLGKEFYNILRTCHYRQDRYRVIEVSNGPSEIISDDSKYIHKESFYQYKIVDFIRDTYNLEIAQQNEKTKELDENISPKPKPTLKSNWRKWNWRRFVIWVRKQANYGSESHETYKTVESLNYVFKNVIHVCICVVFYILLVISILFCFQKILACFTHLISPIAITIKKNDIEAIKAQEMEKFKPIEDIFLYLLPTFILFGFFNYYKTNTSIYFLDGKKDKIDEDKSTRAMNLAKMIFISSIISYIVIKCTEEIFYNDCKNLYKLVAAGILLFILMFYFIMMHNKDNDKPGSKEGIIT